MLEIYRDIKVVLTKRGRISEGEASAIAFMLLEEKYNLSRTDVLMLECTNIDVTEALALAERVADGEPIQYVVGAEWFCGLKFHVEPSVLIPRPETEELVRWIVECKPKSVLDIGTGSGCIAVSIAKMLPESNVDALDVSADALTVAKNNAADNKVCVGFENIDILTLTALPEKRYDCIVSNPPYICKSEAKDMEINVLEHEPHIALFVDDSDPLLFYRVIAEKARGALVPGGYLFFEINRMYGKETVDMLSSLGYSEIQLRKDMYDNDRMIKCRL